jgi:hypothetical protein
MLRRNKPLPPPKKPMARGKPPERKKKLRPYSAKTARVKRAKQAEEALFKLEFDYCGVCGGGGFYEYGQPLLQLHHIVGGQLRSTIGHRRENWLILCNRDHFQLTHGGLKIPPLTNGNILYAKGQIDPLYFDESVILNLKGWKNLVDDWVIEKPHEFYIGA